MDGPGVVRCCESLASRLGCGLTEYAELEVRRRRGSGRMDAFEGDRPVERAEQWGAGTDQAGDHMQVNFVHQTKRERLLHDGRTEQVHELVTCGALGLLDGAATPSVTNVNTEG